MPQHQLLDLALSIFPRPREAVSGIGKVKSDQQKNCGNNHQSWKCKRYHPKIRDLLRQEDTETFSTPNSHNLASLRAIYP